MAYTITANVAGQFTTNAEFRAWGKWVSDGLANTGLTKGTDAGQIDWSTANLPTAAYQMQGYEFWGFSDALQNTAPVWLKLQYGSGSANTIPALWWAVGSGYQTGVGNITPGLTGFCLRDASLTNNYMICASAGAFANNTLVAYLSGGINWLIIALAVRGTGSTNNYQQFLSLERTVDCNGSVTGEGVLATWKHGAASPQLGQGVWNPIIGHVGMTTVPADGLGILHPEKGGGTTGANAAVYPVFHDWGGGPFLNPGLNILGYMNPDFTAGTANTFTYYGASHTYMPLGNTAVHTVGGRNANNAVTLMMRWE